MLLSFMAVFYFVATLVQSYFGMSVAENGNYKVAALYFIAAAFFFVFGCSSFTIGLLF